jgi:hypothetical protein
MVANACIPLVVFVRQLVLVDVERLEFSAAGTGDSFNTFDIVEAWLRCPLPVA